MIGFKIFNIEPTNHCNAQCSFCPNGKGLMTRKKGYMSAETLGKALSYCNSNTMGIYGCGEPLLHTEISAMVAIISSHNIKTQLNTNGGLLNQYSYSWLRAAGLSRLILSVDYFDDKIEPTNYVCKDLPIEKFRIFGEKKKDEIQKELHSWGEQIGHENREKIECNFYLDNWVQVMWNGTIVRCCMDFDAKEPLGNVCTYDGKDFTGRRISLCASCKGFRFKNAMVNGDYDGQLPATTKEG
jgi:organic radical activating enzyme